MTTTRRGFLAGMLASGVLSGASWADLGSPGYLSAARMPDQSYRLFGLSHDGQPLFSRPLAGRGHAATAHPQKAEAVAFARRPGTFAQVIDCGSGDILAQLTSPPGRHFMGHGVFDQSGDLLLTPENDYENGRGRIGIWDRRQAYRRVADLASGGIGPHDMLRLPGSNRFVVANGGIDTHPESGRTALNLATMRANLALLDLTSGGLPEVIELSRELRLNSIRHLAVRQDGLLGFAMQWQGEAAQHPPLLGLLPMGGTPQLLAAPDPQHRGLRNYAGSIAFSGNGQQIAITSPRGHAVQVFDLPERRFSHMVAEPDVCGLSASADGFIATAGTGRLRRLGVKPALLSEHKLAWDNHLIALPGGI